MKYTFLVLNIAINDLSGVFPSVLYPRRSISSHSHLAYVKKRPALAAARRAAVSILNEDRSESRWKIQKNLFQTGIKKFVDEIDL